MQKLHVGLFTNFGVFKSPVAGHKRVELRQGCNGRHGRAGHRHEVILSSCQQYALESYDQALKAWESSERPDAEFRSELLGRIQKAAAKRSDSISLALKSYVLLQQARYDDAFINFKRALDQRPNERVVHCYRAMAYRAKNQLSNAANESDQAYQMGCRIQGIDDLREQLSQLTPSRDSSPVHSASYSTPDTRETENRKIEGRFKYTSTRAVTEDDLVGKDCDTLWQMRNEIYARYGVVFTDADVKAYFMKQSWYQPSSTATYDDLTELEKENAKTILHYEQAHKCL